MKVFDVFIADDEAIVLDYFSEGFPWKKLGFRCVGTASNGPDAIEACGRLEPDLIVLDISMPGMTGIEIMERLLPLLPRSVIAFITSYEDFGYVQKALQLGAIDYIIKGSMAPEELAEKILSIRARMLERRRRERESSDEQRALRAFFSSEEAPETSRKGSLASSRFRFHGKPYAVIIVRPWIASWVDAVYEHEPHVCAGAIAGILESKFDKLFRGAWTEMDGGTFAILAFIGNPERVLPLHEVETLLDAVQGVVQGGLAIHAGVSLLHESSKEAAAARREAEQASLNAFYEWERRVHVFKGPWSCLDKNVERKLNEISACNLATPPVERYATVVSEIIELARERRLHPDQARMIMTGLLVRLSKLFEKKNMAWESALWPLQAAVIASAEQLEAWANETVCGLLISSGLLGLRPQIQRVVDKIENEFSLPLNLASAAKIAAMHPNYFSSVFREETGRTFNEHLSAVRIQHAVEYMSEGVWQMQQIAEMVGIPNYRTFFNSFLRIMRMTPTDFLQSRDARSPAYRP